VALLAGGLALYLSAPAVAEIVARAAVRVPAARPPFAGGASAGLDGPGGADRHWPQVDLDRNEREGSRKEACIAVLKGATRSYRSDLGCARWEQLAVGESFTARVQGGSTVKELR